MRDAAFAFALVLLFGLTRCLLGCSVNRPEARSDAESEAEPGEPTVRAELAVEPPPPEKTEENREYELEAYGRVMAA